MTSHLRLQTSFEPFTAEQTQSHYVRSPPAKKQKMSLTQTYYIAASARSKLGREAARPDHDLRLLVGHANLLDSLMIELADAEREQEAWFNQTVKKAQKAEESRHIQWADTIIEDAMEEDDYDDSASDTSDSSSDSEFDEEEFQMIAPLRRIPSPPVSITTTEVDEYDEEDEEEEYYDEEDDDEHALTRTHSVPHSPPELIEDDFSDEEMTPPSPPQPSMDFAEDQRQTISTPDYYEKSVTIQQAALLKDGFFIPERQSPLIAGY